MGQEQSTLGAGRNETLNSSSHTERRGRNESGPNSRNSSISSSSSNPSSPSLTLASISNTIFSFTSSENSPRPLSPQIPHSPHIQISEKKEETEGYRFPLADETLLLVFYYLRFDPKLARVCKRWNQIFVSNFHISKYSSIRRHLAVGWNNLAEHTILRNSIPNIGTRATEIMMGIERLVIQHQRNFASLFGCKTLQESSLPPPIPTRTSEEKYALQSLKLILELSAFTTQSSLFSLLLAFNPLIASEDILPSLHFGFRFVSMSIDKEKDPSRSKSIEILQHLLRHPNSAVEEVLGSFITSVRCNRIELVCLLLKDPRVDPTVTNNLPLRIACEDPTQVDMVRVLLGDRRIDPSAHETLSLTCRKGSDQTMQLLLDHPRTQLSDSDGSKLLVQAASLRKLRMFRIILSHPRIDPNGQNQNVLDSTLTNREQSMALSVVSHPRFNPLLFDFAAIKICLRHAFQDGMDKIMQHPNVKALHSTASASPVSASSSTLDPFSSSFPSVSSTLGSPSSSGKNGGLVSSSSSLLRFCFILSGHPMGRQRYLGHVLSTSVSLLKLLRLQPLLEQPSPTSRSTSTSVTSPSPSPCSGSTTSSSKKILVISEIVKRLETKVQSQSGGSLRTLEDFEETLKQIAGEVVVVFSPSTSSVVVTP